MKKFLLSTTFVATFALLAACGDDVTEVTEVNEIHQDGIAMLGAGLELSKQKCDSANVGEMLYVMDSAMVFMCDGGIWVSLKGTDGENGSDGENGESCTAKPVKNEAGVDGLEVTCGKTVVGTIWNGEKGEPGKDGEDGDDGNDGESCTAEPVTMRQRRFSTRLCAALNHTTQRSRSVRKANFTAAMISHTTRKNSIAN